MSGAINMVCFILYVYFPTGYRFKINAIYLLIRDAKPKNKSDKIKRIPTANDRHNRFNLCQSISIIPGIYVRAAKILPCSCQERCQSDCCVICAQMSCCFFLLFNLNLLLLN